MSRPKKWLLIVIITLATTFILFSLISGPKLIMPGATTKKNVTANIFVFEDLNGDGQQNNNEGPLPNALIVAHSNIHGGFTRQTRLSDTNGKATVSVTYTHYFDVGVLPPCGYIATTPNSLSVTKAGPFAIQRFGFQAQSKNPPTSINSLHFKLWFDINRDGQQQADEPPLPDMTLALIPPLDISYKHYGFDDDSLVLTTDETGQATLDVGNFCGKIWLKQPKEWRTTMTTPDSLQNDDQLGFTTQAGQTDITWGLYSAKALITPVPIGHRFDFSFGGAYHPDGMGEWRVSLRSSGRFSVSHQIGDVTDSYGPVTLTRSENKAVWAAILAADTPGLPPTFQRPGIPDETAYTFSLYDGDNTHRAEMWVDDAQQYEGVPPLVELIGKLVAAHTGKKME